MTYLFYKTPGEICGVEVVVVPSMEESMKVMEEKYWNESDEIARKIAKLSKGDVSKLLLKAKGLKQMIPLQAAADT